MAHAAKIVDDVVTQVIAVSDEVLTNGGEFSSRNEVLLNEYLQDIGLGGTWKLTSYNNNFRGVYAGIGYTYDRMLDIFISPEINGREKEDIIEEEDTNA